MRVSASKVGLLQQCSYFASPEAVWTDSMSEAAERGIAFHKAIAEYIETGALSDDESIAGRMRTARAFADGFRSNHLGLEVEVAFAWCPITDTAQRIEVKDRDYSAYSDRLCGTADLVHVVPGDRIGYIGDWKTGDASKSAAQLRTLALMLARAEDLDTVWVEAIEVSDDGLNMVCREKLTEFDFVLIAGELANSLSRVGTEGPRPGPHCSDLSCPAKATCPAGAEIINELIPAESLTRHKWELEVKGPDHAVWLLDRVKLVEAAAKAVKDAIRAAVPDAGWQLEDGRALRHSTRQMPRFSKDKAIKWMAGHGASTEDIEDLTVMVTENAGLRVVGTSKDKRQKKSA